MTDKEKLLVICGPTASGKSSLAVTLAQKFSGEIISADSRQVYRGLDIATGKVTEEEKAGVPHHLLDVADPAEAFSVHDYKQLADKKVAAVHDREKLPVLCGGSGFYIQAVVDDLVLPDVPRNDTLRSQLQQRSTESLYKELREKDPRRAAEIDKNNPVRLIRALEIVAALGQVPKLEKQERFETLQIGLQRPDKELKQRIIKRTKQRFDRGMLTEAQNLHKNGLSFQRMRKLGLEYELLADYHQDKITKQELFEKIIQADWQYARRQRTWFRKDDRITWLHPEKDKATIRKMVADLARK